MGYNNSNEIMNLSSAESDDIFSNPKIVIQEQPASTAIRFRYECEGRSSGSIPGENSTEQNPTYPKATIYGYNGNDPILIVVSCVTKEPPYRVHPNNLVGAGCHDGICKFVLDNGQRTFELKTLGIGCVRRPDMQASLQLRQRKKVDPFKQGYNFGNRTIDQNTVRLCIQAFIVTGNRRKPLTPVVSNPIYNKKFLKELCIAELSHCCAPAEGGNKIMLLTENTNRNVKVRFYDNYFNWEAYAEVLTVHHHEGLVLRIPPYQINDITQDVCVQIELVNHLEKKTSNFVWFKYTPSETLRRKRARSTQEFSELQSQITCQLNETQLTNVQYPLLNTASTSEFQFSPQNNYHMCHQQPAYSHSPLHQNQSITNMNLNQPAMAVRDEENNAQTSVEIGIDIKDLYMLEEPIHIENMTQELRTLSFGENINHITINHQ